MDTSIKQPFSSCPICGDPYLLYVTDVVTRRTKRNIPLYGCLSCRSFSNPSGYIEDEDQLRRDLEWHLNVEDRNQKAARHLLKALVKEGVNCSNILEIGAGIGTLLNVAKTLGYSGVGYEVNALTQSVALEKFGVDVRAEFWTKDTKTDPFTLLACISVLEHIDQPRDLIRNIAAACIDKKAQCFISVPFVERELWHFITKKDPTESGTPFFDNDVHVTHFSKQGLSNVLNEFGLSQQKWLSEGLWQGVIASAP